MGIKVNNKTGKVTIGGANAAFNNIATAVRSFNQAEMLVNQATEGAYTVFTRLAATEGGEAFKASIDALFLAIQENTDDIGMVLGCEPRDSGKGCKVPSKISTIKSVLCDAIELEVALVGDDGKPRSYNAIKTEKESIKKAAKEAADEAAHDEAMAKRTDGEAGRDGLVLDAQKLVTALSGLDTSLCDSNHASFTAIAGELRKLTANLTMSQAKLVEEAKQVEAAAAEVDQGAVDELAAKRKTKAKASKRKPATKQKAATA